MFRQKISFIKYAFILAAGSLSFTACSSDSAAIAQNGLVAGECTAGAPLGVSDAGLEIITLCIDIKDGAKVQSTRPFSVEVARTDAEQSRGLMFRTELADDKGMIFPYESEIPLSFWMKNTVISLDIIFINTDGSIANIARDTVPYSLDSVSSVNPAIAVLELRAGLTKELDIKEGDIIRWQ